MNIKDALKDLDRDAALFALARAMGGVHTTVALGLATPRDDVPLVATAAAGVGVYLAAKTYLEDKPLKLQLVWSYLVPVAACTALRIVLQAPENWDAATGQALLFFLSVLRSTPLVGYLLAAGYAYWSGKKQNQSPGVPS